MSCIDDCVDSGVFSSDADCVFADVDASASEGYTNDDDARRAASPDSSPVSSAGCPDDPSSDADPEDMDDCGRDTVSGDSACGVEGGSIDHSAADAGASGLAECDSGLCADSLLAGHVVLSGGPVSAMCGVPRC